MELVRNQVRFSTLLRLLLLPRLRLGSLLVLHLLLLVSLALAGLAGRFLLLVALLAVAEKAVSRLGEERAESLAAAGCLVGEGT